MEKNEMKSKKKNLSHTRSDSTKEKISKKSVSKELEKKNENILKGKIFTKQNTIYFLIALCDIILVIFCARKNKAHYVSILDNEIFVGRTKNLLFGRNNVNLLISGFSYCYLLLINKFFLKKRNTVKFIIWSFLVVFVVNILLFYFFTKRIY